MIWVISGTQDGREIAGRLADQSEKLGKEEILMTVVSQYGKVLAEHRGIDIKVGRFKKEDMVRIIRENHISVILDASHPYAAIVSETAQAACRETGIHYVRYERPEVPLPHYGKLHEVENEEAAAKLAGRLGSHILLTTGSKTLPVFVKSPALRGKEIWARVLPTSQVLSLCESLGLRPKNIIAVQGPFSYEMNRATIRDYQIDVMVTKNSGLIGGSDTKIKAAMDAGISIIIIDRPRAEIQGFPVFHSEDAVVKYMEDMYGLH